MKGPNPLPPPILRPVMHGATAVLLLLGWPAAGHAQGKLDARYVATLAGIPIGKGAWVIDIADDHYTAAASGATTGLLSVFAGGQGSGASRGTVSGGQPVSTSYAATIVTERKRDEVRMLLASGNVRDFAVEPPLPPNPERVPITDAHRRGVTDPMTASLYRVAGNADPLSANACPRTLSIFDGRMRYDLRLAFKRIDQVRAERGYQGPAVVCSVSFTPIAGFVPDRPAIRYLAAQHEIEAWLVPVAGTRVLVPFRVSVPTPLGLGVLQATHFVSTAQPSRRPTAASAKTQ
jgi:Protein of unknown function (DUF3108)